MQAARGEKILYYQRLYMDYSRLLLTRPTDRPSAIAGLQERVLAALGASGDYGVFDEERQKQHLSPPGRGRGLLRRSLLWCRGQKTESMQRIEFETDSQVPSWSWMAVTGGIDYIEPKFGDVDWETLESPWSPGNNNDNRVLVAQSYEFVKPSDDDKGWYNIVLDRPSDSLGRTSRCVVMGRDRIQSSSPAQTGMATGRNTAKRNIFVLVVTQTEIPDGEGGKFFQRVGAGSLSEKYVFFSKSSRVRIA